MRISINLRPGHGPGPGQNRFVRCLTDYLTERGHSVSHSLTPDLDVVLLVTVQRKDPAASFSLDEVVSYRRLYPRTAVVLRANRCDQQRGTEGSINRDILEASRVSDHTVFVSRFLRDLLVNEGFDESRPHSVIATGADTRRFHPGGSVPWTAGDKLRLVTHHWLLGPMKGWDIYERIDGLLGKEPFSELFEFSFIGHVTRSHIFRRSRMVAVLDDERLATELRRHHVYVTGARYEPGGNHYVEGRQCGLPVLYLDSGANSEYCGGCGIGFTPVDLEEKLLQLLPRYRTLRQAAVRHDYTATHMAHQYAQLFTGLTEQMQHEPRRLAWSDRMGGRATLTAQRLRRVLREQRRRAA